MYERILVPLDGSPLAEVALPYAELLAGNLGSEVILVNISESAEDPYYYMRKVYMRQIAETTQQSIEIYRRESGLRPIQARSAILVGNPAEKIIEYAEKEDVGLIVMATHGRSGIKRWALGNVADKVVRSTRRPVALIRARDAQAGVRPMGILKKVLVPLDGSVEGETTLPYVRELASKLMAEVVLLQVITTDVYKTLSGEGYVVYEEQQMESDRAFAKDYLDQAGSRLKDTGLTVASEVMFGNPAEEIIRFAEEIHADIVAMSTHGRSGFTRWVFGSVAERVLRDGKTPLLLVREAGATIE